MKHRLNDDLSFIKDPNRWPQWPYLPVKRYRNHSDIECGFLFQGSLVDKGVEPIITLGNIFALSRMTPKEREELKEIVYSSLEELLADGWIVD